MLITPSDLQILMARAKLADAPAVIDSVSVGVDLSSQPDRAVGFKVFRDADGKQVIEVIGEPPPDMAADIELIRQDIERENRTRELFEEYREQRRRDANEHARQCGYGRYAQAAAMCSAMEVLQVAHVSGHRRDGESLHGWNARPEGKPIGYRKAKPDSVTLIREETRKGRNERCRCGCGKKIKHCPKSK